jgi:periplasmic protein TonB
MAEGHGPLLYRPPQAWYFWGALGAAVAIHLTAVALAQKHEQPVEVPPDIPTAVVEATLQATEEPTPPPEDIPLPEPPPPPDIKPEYVEETTPPPKRPQAQKFTPIKAPQAAGRPGTMSISSAKALATYAPRPQYPYEARSRHVTGSGVCVVEVGPSGSVTSASMASSIGNPSFVSGALNQDRFQRLRSPSHSP